MLRNIFIQILALNWIALTSACQNTTWKFFQGNCYLFVPDKQNWFHASKACRDMDAVLVDIQSQAEDTFLKQTIAHQHAADNPQTIGYWCGGNDLATEGRWVWGYPSDEAMTYTDWYPGEPNNVWYDHRSEDCVSMWGHDNHRYAWNDEPCDNLEFYVCKMEGVNNIIG